MRVCICWSFISGYMAACWKALAGMPGVELKVIVFAPEAGHVSAPFTAELMDGLDVTFLSPLEKDDDATILRHCLSTGPTWS